MPNGRLETTKYSSEVSEHSHLDEEAVTGSISLKVRRIRISIDAANTCISTSFLGEITRADETINSSSDRHIAYIKTKTSYTTKVTNGDIKPRTHTVSIDLNGLVHTLISPLKVVANQLIFITSTAIKSTNDNCLPQASIIVSSDDTIKTYPDPTTTKLTAPVHE